MKPPTVIELSGATITAADGSVVLEHVDWRVEEGDFWVIAGGHGSGKSALLATVAGLNPAGGGEVRVFGEELTPDNLLATGRRRVGLVFEAGGRLLRDLTVAENIALPVSYHENCSLGEALDQVLPLIAALQLEGHADASAGRIGRAWSQRIALARALAAAPELLLLDNPIAGLDQDHIRW
ncbi:MAG TPA: ABC transporter ATP-binding protein, partial [Verrucomicrobiales bacterium]|nr:ABC transporter ATP-binding protein [Verrucomicrobiales bacterium]